MGQYASESADIVDRLSRSGDLPQEANHLMDSFAKRNGWRPSELLSAAPETRDYVAGHVVVEHGLSHTATITFLRDRRSFASLDSDTRLRIASLSYNNLVDWQIFPDVNGAAFLYTRSDLLEPEFVSQKGGSADPWTSTYFCKHIISRSRPKIPALNESLIDTIRHWRRVLHSELGEAAASNEILGDIFNAIILLRAVEDMKKWKGDIGSSQRIMLDPSDTHDEKSGFSLIETAAERLGVSEWISSNIKNIRAIDRIPIKLQEHIIYDFYQNRYSPFQYDFSIISKHALGRIYEDYVGMLRAETSPQLYLFHKMSKVERERALAAVYTPQYIGSFFRRLWEQHNAPIDIRKARILDPACGSGILLRSMVEAKLQANRCWQGEAPDNTFVQDVQGIDIDPAACSAAYLSLSLLHLLEYGELPQESPILNLETIQWAIETGETEKYDIIVANPPYVGWNAMPVSMQQRVIELLGENKKSKPDLYMAFLYLAATSVVIGGMIMFVIPFQFLNSQSAAAIRRHISDQFDVVALVDLSAVNVFDYGVYVILLVCRRRETGSISVRPRATVVKCRAAVGAALADAVEGRSHVGDDYETFQISQDHFQREHWEVLSPDQMQLLEKLEKFPRLDQFYRVMQGAISGCDSAFVLEANLIPQEELDVWAPLLRDREIIRFGCPEITERRMFYPFRNNEKLTEDQLRGEYPWTWNKLISSSAVLHDRGAVQKEKLRWWEPERTRDPSVMLTPKVVCPELMAFPRFGIDLGGKFVVSHSPYIINMQDGSSPELLKYLCAILNSTIGFWQMTQAATRYQRGFAKILPRNLKSLRLPNPSALPPSVFKRLCEIADSKKLSIDLDALDNIVSDAYELSVHERSFFGNPPL